MRSRTSAADGQLDALRSRALTTLKSPSKVLLALAAAAVIALVIAPALRSSRNDRPTHEAHIRATEPFAAGVGRAVAYMRVKPGMRTVRGTIADDTIDSRDGARQWISCGPGRDAVLADRIDRVARNCERVLRSG